MTREHNFNLSYFILGILFIIVSLMAFKNPLSDLVAISVIFGLAALLKGIFELFFRRKLEEYAGFKSTTLIVLGVIDLLIGIFFLFDMNASILALPYLFAIWFIIDSFGELLAAGAIRFVNSSLYWFTICLGILGIIIGGVLLFNPVSSAITLAFLVGFYFMLVGIRYLVSAF